MKVIHFSSIDSTNKYAKENYQSLDNLTFIFTDYQSEGKGRGNHNWMANKGENGLFSIFINDPSIINQYELLPFMVPYLIGSYIEDNYKLDVSIKWPNDVYVNNKKVCGILLESRIPEYIVIGIGINVNQKIFNGDYAHLPSSLSLELSRDIDLQAFLDTLFDYLYRKLSSLNLFKEDAFKYIYERNYLLNKEVSFIYNNNSMRGIVRGIDDRYNLVVEVDNKLLTLNSGEVNNIK